jgi:hypothetical protein
MNKLALLLVFAVACSRASGGPPSQNGKSLVAVATPSATAGAVQVPIAVAESKERVFGNGVPIGNLVVYPVFLGAQTDPGPIISLEQAIEAKSAEVRELSSASVNNLAIENKGSVPVFVLAGTIVKGGNQDRQIGQDFILEPKKVTQVDAFCVEHGRWNGNRGGNVTGGRFTSSQVIAPTKVRVAGQYKKNQSEVWSEVEETTTATHQATASGTLMASVDDGKLAQRRNALAAQIDAVLRAQKPEDLVVGYAYAIGGDIRGARWFEHHKLFEMHRSKLLQGIALELITEEENAKAHGTLLTPTKEIPPASAVEAFVKGVDNQASSETRDTAGGNVNEYKESAKAYGSSTKMKGGTFGKPGAKVSSDYSKK